MCSLIQFFYMAWTLLGWLLFEYFAQMLIQGNGLIGNGIVNWTHWSNGEKMQKRGANMGGPWQRQTLSGWFLTMDPFIRNFEAVSEQIIFEEKREAYNF